MVAIEDAMVVPIGEAWSSSIPQGINIARCRLQRMHFRGMDGAMQQKMQDAKSML